MVVYMTAEFLKLKGGWHHKRWIPFIASSNRKHSKNFAITWTSHCMSYSKNNQIRMSDAGTALCICQLYFSSKNYNRFPPFNILILRSPMTTQPLFSPWKRDTSITNIKYVIIKKGFKCFSQLVLVFRGNFLNLQKTAPVKTSGSPGCPIR